MAAASGNTDKPEYIEGLLKSCARHFSFEWEDGALLIIDNWRRLHARGLGAESAESRRLRRWNIGENYGLGA